MKILLTGATGYIGKRLLPILIANGHKVVCGVRDPSRFTYPSAVTDGIEVIRLDLLDDSSMDNIPADIDGAYYLVHSMSASQDYGVMEKMSAINFRKTMEKTAVKHVIYLSGIVNEEILSDHLTSRKSVEAELEQGNFNLTTLRAGIIIGSGSASFEIIRDLVEKLPVMVTPKWLNTRCQPIGISDVLLFLSKTLFCKETFNRNFDIGGPDILMYKEMLMEFAKLRKLKRYIFTVPVMTPRLSSYWLYFVTSTSYKLAVALVDSMKIEVICRNDEINKLLGIQPLNYQQALSRAFDKIESNSVISSWKDSFVSGNLNFRVSEFIEVPAFGCFKDERKMEFIDRRKTIDRLWSIGGETGWYYANTLWQLRGLVDRFFGGVGLRRARTSKTQISVGDALDFWRVLYADKEEGRLLLFAEMKLPGEAWLEFQIQENTLVQTATFRPRGLMGRLYWYSIVPLHSLVFGGMIRGITGDSKK